MFGESAYGVRWRSRLRGIENEGQIAGALGIEFLIANTKCLPDANIFFDGIA